MLGDSTPEVDRLLVQRAEVFWPLPRALSLVSGVVLHVVTVCPVVPLPARSILLKSIFSHLIVVEALVANCRWPLSVGLVGIDWSHLLIIFLALFQLDALEWPSTS